jgi:DNA-binding transcriptional LysR family regulator
MLDSVSLDQLRTFIAALDEGSFSDASRKLRRAQSVVSETVSNLEDQIGVLLFDRCGRYPKLTPAGIVLLADARSIVTGVDLLKARAKGMAIGLEPELSVVVDVFYPIDAITEVAKEFGQKYPGVLHHLNPSQWKPVTTVRADCEFAIAFRVPPPPPSPVPPPPRRLEGRCSGRYFFHDRRVDRNGARTRSTTNRKPSRQAEKDECAAHECLPGSPRRQPTALPFSSTCSARCASNPVGVAWRTHPPAPHPFSEPGR